MDLKIIIPSVFLRVCSIVGRDLGRIEPVRRIADAGLVFIG